MITRTWLTMGKFRDPTADISRRTLDNSSKFKEVQLEVPWSSEQTRLHSAHKVGPMEDFRALTAPAACGFRHAELKLQLQRGRHLKHLRHQNLKEWEAVSQGNS